MKKGLVYLELGKVQARMESLCMGPDELYRKAKIDARAGRPALEGKRIRAATAKLILKALGVEDFAGYITPVYPLVETNDDSIAPRTINEWEVDSALTPVITATNGLQYQIFKLRHQHLPDRWGRSKCYMLNYRSTKERQALEEHLVRHAKTCDRVGVHPNIPINETACPDPGGDDWWVIDRWVPGETLETILTHGPLPRQRLASVMRQVAEGLKALHAADIVRRELSPTSIVVNDENDSVVLTDFELAKLFDGSPTVSSEHVLETYCAPEVGAGRIDVGADLYSFGRVLVHAATGALPDRGEDRLEIDSLKLPESVAEITKQCLALPRSERPKDINAVLQALKRWR